jgi:hypothetical protein
MSGTLKQAIISHSPKQKESYQQGSSSCCTTLRSMQQHVFHPHCTNDCRTRVNHTVGLLEKNGDTHWGKNSLLALLHPKPCL